MSVLTSRPGLRWIVPTVATVAVLGGGAAIGAITAAADPALPTQSPAELLVDLQTAQLDSLSGTIVTRADLGLPALPLGGHGGAGAANLGALLTGTHTVRVWFSGPDKARVALLDTLGETDVIANGSDLWTWSSEANEATHRTISLGSATPGLGGPGGIGHPVKPGPGPLGGLGQTPLPLPSGSFTPEQIANLAIAALNATTDVSSHGTDRIAGRDAYELVLAPRDPDSLIGSVRLAIDAQTHVPLRAQVFARDDSSPAIEVAFTEVSFSRPDPAEFTFNPPPGTTIDQAGSSTAPTPKPAEPKTTTPKFAVVGTGWTSVLVVRTPDALFPAAVLNSLPTVSGGWGKGHLLKSKLADVLITDDGRTLLGAVGSEQLYAAAADPAAQLPA
jgi:outer membrane lipoprotein-sorting protein